MSNYRFHQLMDGVSDSLHLAASSPALWERGLRATLDRLPSSTAILLLEDFPIPRKDIPSCLVEHVREVALCAFVRANGVAPEITRVERDAARRDPRVTFADLTDHLCVGAICPAVSDHRAVYSDSDHLSLGFAASLSQWLLPIVDTIVVARQRVHR